MGTFLARMPTRTSLAASSVAQPGQAPQSQALQGQETVQQFGRQRLSSGRRVVIDANWQGQFHANVEIEGKVVPMMVDTGATVVSLSWDDAQSMGLSPTPHQFNVLMRTANGIARAALVRLREVRVGGIVVYDVKAVIAPPGQQTPSLLGMTFLNELSHFQISNQKLVLEQ